MGFLDKIKKKGDNTNLCNFCEVKMNEIILLQCPNCGTEAQSEKCPNCNSKMKEIELLQCPECGKIIDEESLKQKWEIKEKFEKLT